MILSYDAYNESLERQKEERMTQATVGVKRIGWIAITIVPNNELRALHIFHKGELGNWRGGPATLRPNGLGADSY
jgi:hypothetical protein